MTVAQTPAPTRQQLKVPTSMRYERVQDILESQPAFRARVLQKTHPVETRFGEKIMLSREAVEITDALHAEGKDAHKASKVEVLQMAARLLRSPTNGEAQAPSPPAPAVHAASAPPAPKAAPKTTPEATPATSKKRRTQVAAPAPAALPAPKTPKLKKGRPGARPVPQTEAAALTQARPARLPKVQSKPTAPVAEEKLPESELPPEKQPLRLPADFDPSKFPHYSVQTSIYGLLLSALNLSEHYEKFPSFEARQRKLEDLLKDYLETCDALKLKTA